MGDSAISIDGPIFVFWASLIVPVIAYLLYPVGVVLAARLARPGPSDASLEWPSVTVAIAAHDEELTIERVVRSVLGQAYPGPQPLVLVGLDGCTDETRTILERIDDARLSFLELPWNGKAETDNRLVAVAHTDVIVTTSAGSEFAPSTLEALVGPFRDPRVGCSTGVFRPRTHGTGAGAGEGLYWRFENAVMEAESRLGILAMASGTALAFRRALFRPIPLGSDADVIVAPSVVAAGYRVVHVSHAVVFDDGPATMLAVLKSRRRMALRALPATIAIIPELVRSGRPATTAALVAHKLLRWLTPLAGLAWCAAAVAVIIRGTQPESLVAEGIVAIGALAITAGFVAGQGARGATVSLAIAQLAFALALWDVVRGRQARTWTRNSA